MIVMALLLLGALAMMVWGETYNDPDFTHECDMREMLRTEPKENHHRHSSALVYKKP